MVIDFRKNAEHAMGYAVFDSTTGERLDTKLPIVFADDERGILTVLLKDGNGCFYPDATGKEAASETLERKIDITPKA